MLANFRNVFRPTISKQPGFVSVTLLKLRAEKQGKAPAGCSYRADHQLPDRGAAAGVGRQARSPARPGRTVENTLKGVKYIALLYDPVA